MRLVKVYGQLAQRLGQRVFKAAVDSPAEAVRFLCANFPGLDQWLIDSAQDGIAYRVKVSKTTVGEDDFGMFCNPDATISITPVLTGAGGGVGKIIAGTALIALAAFVPLGPAFVGQAVFSIGASLVLGGTAELITPKPPTLGLGGPSPLNDPRALQSYNFNGVQNTSTQGTPVPVVYGKTIVGSVTLSAGIVNTSKK